MGKKEEAGREEGRNLMVFGKDGRIERVVMRGGVWGGECV